MIEIAVYVIQHRVAVIAAVYKADAEHGRGQEVPHAVFPQLDSAAVRIVEAENEMYLGDQLFEAAGYAHHHEPRHAERDDERAGEYAVCRAVAAADAADHDAYKQRRGAEHYGGSAVNVYGGGEEQHGGGVAEHAQTAAVSEVHRRGNGEREHRAGNIEHAPREHRIVALEADDLPRLVEHEEHILRVQPERQYEHLGGDHEAEADHDLARVCDYVVRLVRHGENDEIQQRNAGGFEHADGEIHRLPYGREYAVKQACARHAQHADGAYTALAESVFEHAGNRALIHESRDHYAAADYHVRQAGGRERLEYVALGRFYRQILVVADGVIGQKKRDEHHLDVVSEKRGKNHARSIYPEYGYVGGHAERRRENAQRRVQRGVPCGFLPPDQFPYYLVILSYFSENFHKMSVSSVRPVTAISIIYFFDYYVNRLTAAGEDFTRPSPIFDNKRAPRKICVGAARKI